MFRGASSTAKSSLFFGDGLFRLRLQSVQDDFQHYFFSQIANDTDDTIVLTLLYVFFLGKCNYQCLSPYCWPLSSLPDVVAAVGKMVITYSPPFLNSSAGMLLFHSSMILRMSKLLHVELKSRPHLTILVWPGHWGLLWSGSSIVLYCSIC